MCGILARTYKYYSRYSSYGDQTQNVTTIQIDVELRDMLKSFGHKGDTYSEIIKALIKRANYVDYMRESYQILDTEKEWTRLEDLE